MFARTTEFDSTSLFRWQTGSETPSLFASERMSEKDSVSASVTGFATATMSGLAIERLWVLV
jgi:hypothetical protein